MLQNIQGFRVDVPPSAELFVGYHGESLVYRDYEIAVYGEDGDPLRWAFQDHDTCKFHGPFHTLDAALNRVDKLAGRGVFFVEPEVDTMNDEQENAIRQELRDQGFPMSFRTCKSRRRAEIVADTIFESSGIRVKIEVV